MRQSAGWTLSSRIRLVIALIFAMLAALLLVSNLYSYRVLTDSSVNDRKNTLAIYLEQIKNNLHSATSALNELAYGYMNDTTVFSNKNELSRYLAARDMADRLNVKMVSNPFLECIFVSSPANDIYLTRFNSLITWNNKIALDDYVKAAQSFFNDTIDENWHIVNVLGTSYLIQSFSLNDVYIGAMIRLDSILQLIESTSGKTEGQYVFLDSNGSTLASGAKALLDKDDRIPPDSQIIRGYKGKYFIVSLPVEDTPVRLSVVKPNDEIYSAIDATQYLLIAFSVIALAVLVISSSFVNRYIIVPLRKLFYATKEVERGNLDFHIQKMPASLEYLALINSFNNMVKEIKTLKITSYEERLEKQKTELKYLQMQLKPHFYLNAINTISSLSLQNKNKEIGKFILALSQYLRYLFTDNLSLVTVRNEIDHAVDYINLHQIKYPHMIFYMVDLDDEAVGFMLPKLMIQTFIENIFKHAFTGDEMLSIFIKAQIIRQSEERLAEITIEDNGDGFDAALLGDREAVNRECIGIDNVSKTLLLTFGRDDLISLSNREEGGARVVIRIPEKRAGGDKE